MLKVKEVTDHIEELLTIKDFRLVHEEESLRKFQQSEEKLFDTTSPIPSKRSLTMMVKN